MQTDVVLGLGSNLGDRLSYLKQAISLLEKKQIVKDIVSSSIYSCKAMLMESSPAEWDIDFLNMAIYGKTSLSHKELLEKIKTIEHNIGRNNNAKWAPREIDIDILAYGTEAIIEANLTIPHQYLLQRSWALIPFAEVWPEYHYPVPGDYYQMTIREIANKLFEGVK